MAVTYSLSPPPDVLFGSATTAAGPLYEIRTGPTDYALISRIGLRLINAVGSPVSTIGIGVPAARGSGVQVSYPLISESPQVDGNGLTLAMGWGTPPTVPTTFLRRYSCLTGAATNESQLHLPIFNFRWGYKLLPSSSLVIWLILSGQATVASEFTDLEISV